MEPRAVMLHSLAIIGILVILKYLYRILYSLKQSIAGSSKNIKATYGPWNVVTGATDGIGKATCFELAKRGCNVVLISRTQEKLDAVAKEIKNKYPAIDTKVLAIDYSKFDDDAKRQVNSLFESLGDDFGLLVNNVGVSYDHPEYFHEISKERVDSMITLNIESTTWMTYMAIPFMLKRHEKNPKLRSAIVNVGSAAGLHPNPLLAQYSAAKAYIKYFSQSLDVEYSGKGIDVSVVAPYFIVSKLSKFRKPAMHIPTPEKFAVHMVNSIGSGNSVENPFLPHTIMGFIATSLPEQIVLPQILNFHLGIRKRALQKKEQKRD